MNGERLVAFLHYLTEDPRARWELVRAVWEVAPMVAGVTVLAWMASWGILGISRRTRDFGGQD